MATTKKRLTITMSDLIYKRLSDVSKEKGLSKSALITVALDKFLKNDGK